MIAKNHDSFFAHLADGRDAAPGCAPAMPRRGALERRAFPTPSGDLAALWQALEGSSSGARPAGYSACTVNPGGPRPARRARAAFMRLKAPLR